MLNVYPQSRAEDIKRARNYLAMVRKIRLEGVRPGHVAYWLRVAGNVRRAIREEPAPVTSRAAYCSSCDCRYAAVMATAGPAIAYEYEPDGFTVSTVRHVCWPRDQRIGRLIKARRAVAQVTR